MGATTFQLGISAWMPLPYLCERGRTNELAVSVSRNGEAATITSMTLSVFDPSGTAVVDEATVTPPSNQLAVYAWATPSSLALSEKWRARWTVVISGESMTFENTLMIVRERGVCPVTPYVLWLIAPQLRPTSDTSITTLSSEEQATMLDAAWLEVQRRLLEYGRRPWLVMGGGSALHDVVLQTAMKIIYESLASRLNEAYLTLAEAHRVRAEEQWKRAQLTWDANQDGTPDDGTKAARTSTIWLGRG